MPSKALKRIDSLREALSDKDLAWLAGEKALLAGKTLFSAGQVELVEAGATHLQAKVSDKKVFVAELYLTCDCDLEYKCNCPTAQKEIFCLHCAAAAFCWLDKDYDSSDKWASFARPEDPSSLQTSPDSSLREKLSRLEKESLLDLLTALADRDTGVHGYLSSMAGLPSLLGNKGPKGEDLITEAIEEAIEDAFEEYLYVPEDYDEIQIDLLELEQALEQIFTKPELSTAAGLHLRKRLLKLCQTRFRDALESIQVLDLEKEMHELIGKIEGWASK